MITWRDGGRQQTAGNNKSRRPTVLISSFFDELRFVLLAFGWFGFGWAYLELDTSTRGKLT